jgi:NitT/TauT family transport system permease protein
MNSVLRLLAGRVLPPLALALLVVLVWHAGVRAFDLKDYLLPAPGKVWQVAGANAGRLAAGARFTASAAAAGFASSLVAGSLLAVAFSQSRWVRRGAMPIAIFLQTVPIVAIAPLVIIWFGYGFRSVVIVSFILGLFPIVTNATAGLLAVDRNLLELFALHRAGRWQTLLKLRLPHAVPYLVTGAKVSCGLCVIGAIVGDYFVGYGPGNEGLGQVIEVGRTRFNTALVFAAVLTATALSVCFFVAVSLTGELVLRRWRMPGSAETNESV